MLIDPVLKTKIIGGGIIFLLLLAFTASTVAWYKEVNKQPVSKIEYVDVIKVKEVEKIKKINVPGPTEIVTVEKKVIVEKYTMPSWFTSNTNEQAIASGVIEPYEGRTDVVSTLNTQTGVGQIIAKQEPLSFLGFINQKEFYAKLGYSTNSETQLAIGGQWKFARVGNIKIGMYGEGKGYFEKSGTNTGNRDNTEVVGGIVLTY